MDGWVQLQAMANNGRIHPNPALLPTTTKRPSPCLPQSKPPSEVVAWMALGTPLLLPHVQLFQVIFLREEGLASKRHGLLLLLVKLDW